MTTHCATCNCRDDGPTQPATSSPGVRRHVLAQTAAAVRKSKDARTAEIRNANEETP